MELHIKEIYKGLTPEVFTKHFQLNLMALHKIRILGGRVVDVEVGRCLAD